VWLRTWGDVGQLNFKLQILNSKEDGRENELDFSTISLYLASLIAREGYEK
jgi:hypothetical protein